MSVRDVACQKLFRYSQPIHGVIHKITLAQFFSETRCICSGAIGCWEKGI